ncbi:MAG: Hpt domain-containing protein [Chlamydiota bacterium]
MSHPDFKALFIEESRKYLGMLEAGSACLDGVIPVPALRDLIRYAHSMKGMAATMALPGIERESARIEETLRGVGSGARGTGPELRAEILASLAAVRALVEEYGSG